MMATHLIRGRARHRVSGASEVHTYCGLVVSEGHPDFAALSVHERDHTASYLAALFDDVPNLCEECRESILSPKTYHIESENGLTYCGMDAKEVWIGGPFIRPLCRECRDALISEHPAFGR